MKIWQVAMGVGMNEEQWSKELTTMMSIDIKELSFKMQRDFFKVLLRKLAEQLYSELWKRAEDKANFLLVDLRYDDAIL